MTVEEEESYQDLKQEANLLAQKISTTEQEHLARYLKSRPVDHIHEKDCQSLKSWGGGVCTCEINRVLRRQAILDAGKDNNRIVLHSLGSFEQCTWHEGRRSVEASHRNPYLGDRQ